MWLIVRPMLCSHASIHALYTLILFRPLNIFNSSVFFVYFYILCCCCYFFCRPPASLNFPTWFNVSCACSAHIYCFWPFDSMWSVNCTLNDGCYSLYSSPVLILSLHTVQTSVIECETNNIQFDCLTHPKTIFPV